MYILWAKYQFTLNYASIEVKSDFARLQGAQEKYGDLSCHKVHIVSNLTSFKFTSPFIQFSCISKHYSFIFPLLRTAIVLARHDTCWIKGLYKSLSLLTTAILLLVSEVSDTLQSNSIVPKLTGSPKCTS